MALRCLALALGIGVAASALGKQSSDEVGSVNSQELTVKPPKLPKFDVTEPSIQPAMIKEMKVVKLQTSNTNAGSPVIKEMKVKKLTLDGMDWAPPPKLPDADETIATGAAKAAEQAAGPSSDGSDGPDKAEIRAENDASIRAQQQAVQAGDGAQQAASVADAARQQVRKDYGDVAPGERAAEGSPSAAATAASPAAGAPGASAGAGEAPAAGDGASAAGPGAAANGSGDALPEVLEPPQDDVQGQGSVLEGDQPSPGVVEVPPAP
ncbi:MAG: hypothetical protein ACYCWW_13825 [Deltaproteobacteria bacterium]